jgi:sugar phosphate isomerase/epimerase
MSRRGFIKTAVIGAAGEYFLLRSKSVAAEPLNLPIGLELDTVGSDFDSDPHGTLEKVAAIGYKQVELSPVSKAPLSEIKKALADSGLKNPSGHYFLPDLLAHLDDRIETAKELGQEYMIVTNPWVADTSRFQSEASNRMEMLRTILNGLTLEDWKWNAEQFNKIGDQIKRAGLQLGYHNHEFEFRKIGESTGYDEFLRLTDSELVALELDCGWMAVAGLDPVTYLTKYASRYRLLHIKDFKKGFMPTTTFRMGLSDAPGTPVPTELGRGVTDYARILPAARNSIRALFVEQEPPFSDMPALEAIKVDFAYLYNLKV